MKSKQFNEKGTKMIINSGWKTFDEQTNAITPGCAISNTQFSRSVRPYGETVCNNTTHPKGLLMRYDLQGFSRYRIPTNIENILRDENREKSVLLYMFFTTDSAGNIEPFCWVVTDMENNIIDKLIVVGYKQNYAKRATAAEKAISYISA